MNTDKTIHEKFARPRQEHPIWYYKELKEVTVDYVIWNLLKESFVVDIQGSKHEITFGKNDNDEIGQGISYDDIKNSNLCSYEVIEQGFREGIWYIITDRETTEEYKKDYIKRKEEYEKKELEDFYRKGLKNVINEWDIANEDKKRFKKEIDECNFKTLEMYMKKLFKLEKKKK